MSDSTYRGTTPRPADFDAFWDARMAEADAVPLCYAVEPSEIPAYPTCEYLNLWFTGMGGARIYAKYLRPKSDKPLPLVLQFHGYPGASRSWLEQSSFAGMGYALLAMDCPGQGGAQCAYKFISVHALPLPFSGNSVVCSVPIS